MIKDEQELTDLIYAWLFNPRPPAGNEDIAPRLAEILEYVGHLRNILSAFSKGSIDEPVNIRGFLGGHLKALQANLRHLTWQAHMVAQGDLRQRVSFMGEFSEAFNKMVEQLERNMHEIATSRDKLAELNDTLLRRIKLQEIDEENLRRSERHFKQLAINDQLTNTFTRRQFLMLANMELKNIIQENATLCLLMIDADFFKKVNDTYGHIVGDQVLRSLSDRFKKVLREKDILARYGGEEFVIILPRVSKDIGFKVAERLRTAVCDSPVKTSAGEIFTSISMGQTFFSGMQEFKYQLENIEEILLSLINQADIALYNSKHGGRNRVSFGGPENGD
jgi:diguanylate cyclase (GGDEF)-like protein